MALASNFGKKQASPVREEEYALPSAGIPYLGAFPDMPKNVVIKPYSFQTESILISNLSAYDKFIKMLPKVVTNFPAEFKWGEMLLDDMIFVFVCARALTYGETFSFTAVCPSCSHNEKLDMHIPADAPTIRWVRPGEKASPKKGIFLADDKFFNIFLPNLKDEVRIKFLTLAEDNKLTQNKSRMSQTIKSDDSSFLRRLAMNVVSVNGGEPDSPKEVMDYLMNLQGEDMVVFKDELEAKSPGFMDRLPIECEKCNHQYSVVPGFTSNFFRRRG